MAEFKYNLDLDLSAGNSHALMVELIGHNKRVLEFGCATGYMSRVLAERGCTVIGVEIDPAAAKQAEEFCERVIVGDADEFDIADEVSPGSFDVVVFGDVLEHMKDPLRAVRSVRSLLVPEGYVVASIPNIAHGAVRLSLLQGKFQYQKLGLLDNTHIRFFTRESIEDLFRSAGFVIGEVARVVRDLFETELPVSAEDFPPDVLERVGGDPESRTYQFVVKALVDNGLDLPRKLAQHNEALQLELSQCQVQLVAYKEQNDALERDRDQWLSKVPALETEVERWRTEALGLEEDRDRWRTLGEDQRHEAQTYRRRAAEAEERIRELAAEVGQARADVEILRHDRDQWRAEAERLASPRTPGIKTAKAIWARVPEPTRRLARPTMRRVQSAMRGPRQPGGATTSEPSGEEGHGVAGTVRVDDELISVLIPTLNAGPEFARNLDSIRSQEGVGNIEILVADSGSSDGTAAVAASMGARVLAIPPEEFNHGGTRNRLAEMASGDVLLMTVQDARLVGRHALRDLVSHLRSDDQIAAVTARAVPRAGSDLFSSFLALAHQRFLADNLPAGRAEGVELMTLSQRRAACSVDNVCAVFQRGAWEQIRFRELAFGEDLDFGLRAAKDGWRLATCNDAVVVHSHDRGAGYHLRRIVVDRLFLIQLLGDTGLHPAAAMGLDAVAAASLALAGQIEAAVQAATSSGWVALDGFLRDVARHLLEERPPLKPSGELAELVDVLAGERGEPRAPGDAQGTDVLRLSFRECLEGSVLGDFAAVQGDVATGDARDFVGKLATLVIGTAVADAMSARPVESALGRRLTVGV